MRIIKFNESKLEYTKSAHETALSEMNLTIKDMEIMLFKLKKYEKNLTGASELIEDMEKVKDSGWTKLRKWKLENIVSRYEVQKVKISEIDNIEDYLLEMEDEGWEVDINVKYNVVKFETEGHPIKKMSTLFHFLDSNHRLGFLLQGVENTRGKWAVTVKYKIRTGDNDTKKEEDMAEEEDQKEMSQLMRDRLRQVRVDINGYMTRAADDYVDLDELDGTDE
jgi:hypothetical protein